MAASVIVVFVILVRRKRADLAQPEPHKRTSEDRPAAVPKAKPKDDQAQENLAIKLVMENLFSSNGRERARKALAESGLVDADDVETYVDMMSIVAISHHDKKNPDEVLQTLTSAGISEKMAKAAMVGFIEALEEHALKKAGGVKRPTAQEVFARLVILKFVVVHSILNPPKDIMRQGLAQGLEFERKLGEMAEANVAKLRELGLWEQASPKEQAFLQSFGSQMEEYAQIAASWRMECAGMLMWALGLIDEWPKIDEEHKTDLLKIVPVSRVESLPKPPTLRPEEEISKRRDRIESWHWRVRTRQLIEEGRPFPADANFRKVGFQTFDDIVRFTAKAAHEQGDLPEIIEEDFVFLGKPFRSLSSDEYQKATSIITERHYALNWLCGMAPGNSWDDTPTDT